MSELGMALLMKSDTVALLTDFEGDAALHAAAKPKPEAQQRNAADVVAQAPLLARSPGRPGFASLYDAQSQYGSQTAARDEEARGARHDGTSELERPQLPVASAPNVSAPPEFAAYGLTPQTACVDARHERRQERERRRHEPEQRDELEPQEKPGYTIDDIVQFAGVTIAERHTPPADLATTDRP